MKVETKCRQKNVLPLLSLIEPKRPIQTNSRDELDYLVLAWKDSQFIHRNLSITSPSSQVQPIEGVNRIKKR